MKWRWPTWAFLIWTGLAALWIYTGAGNVEALFVFFNWLLVAAALSMLWYATKPQDRACPACGRQVEAGCVLCNCGYTFAAVQRSTRLSLVRPVVYVGVVVVLIIIMILSRTLLQNMRS